MTRASTKRAVDEAVIDVDALPTTGVTPTFSGKGKGPAKVSRFNDFIDVDNPDTWAMSVPSSAGGSSSGFLAQDQETGCKTVHNGDSGEKSTPPTGDVTTAEGGPADTKPPAIGTVSAFVSVPESVAVSTGENSHASGAPSGVGMVGRGGASRRRSQLRQKDTRASLPRRVRSGKFVRRAAVMTVVARPRMVAGPPTPPPSGSTSDGGASSDDGSGDDADFEASAEAKATTGGQQELSGCAATGTDDQHSVAAARPTAAVSSREAAEVLASQLAARSSAPRILTAAFWMPGAQAVLATAQASRARLPPIAPPAGRHGVPVNATARPAPERGVSPSASRSLPATLPPVADAEDASSSDMDDDALVSAYITPPASPLPASEAPPPRRTQPFSGKRRRGADCPTVRAVTGGAATSGDVEIEPLSLALHDVHEALRNGFASVRRELTRLRSELVVVKSQSASTLRRIDGIAAAADGRESGSGVILERLEVLDRSVHSLGQRLPSTSSGAPDQDGPSENSVELVSEIKVRITLHCLVFFLTVL